MKQLLLFFCLFITIRCTTDIKEIDAFTDAKNSANIEQGENIKIIYSDSALVKVIIYAPSLIRHTNYNEAKDEFPKGILLEFLDKNQKVYSWLKAETAIRDGKTQKITAKGNVVFYNDKDEKLESPELIWDEVNRIVYTDKIIRITQAEKGDTTYGFGFEANQNFTRFEIKKKVQGKFNAKNLVISQG